ncbi:hypothetical protein ACWEK5_27950 [Rhodococcus koreensis]
MGTSSEAAASRSRRLHTVKNVEKNVRAERQKVLDRQKRIEELSKPLNAVSEKLARLDRERDSVIAGGDRRIETLKTNLEAKIEKLKSDTATKIEEAKKETATKLDELHQSQQASEDELLLEYAQAIVQFSANGSPADLATVLGLSQKKAKELIASSTADLEKAGVAVAKSTDAPAATDTAAPEVNDPAPAADNDSPASASVDSPALASA